MTVEAGFNSPEDMQRAYSQMWDDIAGGIGDVPQMFKQVLDFAANNSLAMIVVGLVVALLAFMILRRILSGLERR